MKKITLLLAGLMASGMASAVTVDLTDAATNGSVTTVNCTLLNEDVAINLTTGVAAGVGCNTTVIGIAACHTAGRTTSRSTLQDAAGDACVAGTAGCTSVAVTGPAMPSATTAAGTVISQYPGGDCTGADAATFAESEADDAVPADPAP